VFGSELKCLLRTSREENVVAVLAQHYLDEDPQLLVVFADEDRRA
jgi:hypothetical protein